MPGTSLAPSPQEVREGPPVARPPYRFVTALGLAGATLLTGGTLLHPAHADAGTPAAAFAEYADASRGLWVTAHLLQLERQYGPALTAGVARELVVYLRRNGSSAQVSVFVQQRAHLHQAVHRVQDHLAQRLDTPHTLAELAAVAHLSPRGLSRAFAAAIGMSPLAYQQLLRLEFAAALLAQTDLTVQAVAARCGFFDERQLRRLFSDRHGVPPAVARRQHVHRRRSACPVV